MNPKPRDRRCEERWEALSSHLRAEGWALESEFGSERDFGSSVAVFRRKAQRLRLIWDGKDSVFLLQRSDLLDGDPWLQVGDALPLSSTGTALGSNRRAAEATDSPHLPEAWRRAIEKHGTGDSRMAPLTTTRFAGSDDGDALAAIYNHYITETIVTFEEEPLDGGELVRRLARVEAAGRPWLIAERNGRGASSGVGPELLGYAYAIPWSERVGYRFSSEVTIYLAPDAVGGGIGSLLYRELLDELRRRSQRVAIGGIALPNPASVALHEKLGFEKVAHFARVGTKFGQWIDVGYWQLML